MIPKKQYDILVIEDNIGDFVLLEHFLQVAKLPIDHLAHATNLAKGFQFIEERSFDLVLVDLTLPDSTGVESVVQLNKLIPSTPIVVFSGLSTIEIATQCIAVGAQDYLLKGEFDEKLLAKAIQYSIERKKTTEQLRKTIELFEYANKATQDVIWDWDYISHTGVWGEGIMHQFGYPPEKLGFTEAEFFDMIHPAERKEVLHHILSQIENGSNNWQAEFRFRCADGSYKSVFDRGHILYNENGKPYRLIGAMTDLTEKKRLERLLAEQLVEHQRLITETTIQAQEREKNMLGRELHDNINQMLAVVKMHLEMMKHGDLQLEELIEKSTGYLETVMEEIRRLSHSLVAPSLGDIGLREALEELMKDNNKVNRTQIQLFIDENIEHVELDKNKELMLYRIVQEQLNNISKYARANKAEISLKPVGNSLFLQIEDDGVGFQYQPKNKGIGLKNIGNRVDFYAGTMNVISEPGKGCRLEVLIPTK